VNFGDKEVAHCLKLASSLRQKGIRTEIYPDAAKIKKQMAYADKKEIRFVAMVGEDELSQGLITLKNMQTGEQATLALDEVVRVIKG
jgi:histidyl-tRNA synthetase